MSLLTSPLAKTKQKELTPKGRWNPTIHTTPKRPRRAGRRSIALSARNMEAHTPTHNTKECRRSNKDGSYKKAGGTPKPNKPASGKDGINFAQLIRTETEKAVRSAIKKVNCGKKRRSCHKESDSDSDSDY